MGRLRRALQVVDPDYRPHRRDFVSPWSPHGNELFTIDVPADIFGLDPNTISRAQAMGVPAIRRARGIVASTLARQPIRAYRGAEVVTDQPAWLTRTDAQQSPYQRVLWTVDDLIFHPSSLWLARPGDDGFPTSVEHVPWSAWQFDDDGDVVVDDKPVPSAYAPVVIPGPSEGLLVNGGGVLAGAVAIERGAARAAQTPVPAVDLRQTIDVDLTDAEIDANIARWVRARQGANGGVAWTSYGLEAHALGSQPEQLFLEGRNAYAVDCARMVGVPAASIDATTAGSSLTYETTQGRNLELVDYGLAMYGSCIEARLSLDDVVPRGQRVAFDLTELIGPVPSAAGPMRED